MEKENWINNNNDGNNNTNCKNDNNQKDRYQFSPAANTFQDIFFHSENKEKRSNKKKEGKKVNMLLKIKSSSYKGNSK